MIEHRSTLELRSDGKRLIGYAAVFGLPSEDLGGFTEIINPSAFDRTLSTNPDIMALWDHDKRSVLGRTKSGTLNLKTDSRGLRFEIDAPNTTVGRDVLEMVGRGDVTGASFGFVAKHENWEEHSDGSTTRELLDVDLFEVTITANPAYPDTEVAKRALNNQFAHKYISAYRKRKLKLMEMGL